MYKYLAFEEKNDFSSFAPFAGDLRHAAGEREKTRKCGRLPRDAGDLAGLGLSLYNTERTPK